LAAMDTVITSIHY